MADDDDIKHLFDDFSMPDDLPAPNTEPSKSSAEPSSEPSEPSAAPSADLPGQGEESLSTDNLENDLRLSDFDEQLDGLLGNKAQLAMLVVPFSDAKLSLSLLKYKDVEGWAEMLNDTSFIYLKALDGQKPEDAAQALSQLIRPLPLYSVVKRADKLEVALWVNGKKSGEKLPPPLLFEQLPEEVEDYAIGMTTTQQMVHREGVLDSADFDKQDALDYMKDSGNSVFVERDQKPQHWWNRRKKGGAEK